MAADKKSEINSRLNSFLSMKVAFRWFRLWGAVGHRADARRSSARVSIIGSVSTPSGLWFCRREIVGSACTLNCTSAISPVYRSSNSSALCCRRNPGRLSWCGIMRRFMVAKRLPDFWLNIRDCMCTNSRRMRLNSIQWNTSGLRSIVHLRIPVRLVLLGLRLSLNRALRRIRRLSRLMRACIKASGLRFQSGN